MAALKQAPPVAARGRTVVWCLLALYVLVHLAGVLLGDRLMAVAGILGVGSLAAVLWAMGGLANAALPSRSDLLTPSLEPPTLSPDVDTADVDRQPAADGGSRMLSATGDPRGGSDDTGCDQAAWSTGPGGETAPVRR